MLLRVCVSCAEANKQRVATEMEELKAANEAVVAEWKAEYAALEKDMEEADADAERAKAVVRPTSFLAHSQYSTVSYSRALPAK